MCKNKFPFKPLFSWPQENTDSEFKICVPEAVCVMISSMVKLLLDSLSMHFMIVYENVLMNFPPQKWGFTNIQRGWLATVYPKLKFIITALKSYK